MHFLLWVVLSALPVLVLTPLRADGAGFSGFVILYAIYTLVGV